MDLIKIIALIAICVIVIPMTTASAAPAGGNEKLKAVVAGQLNDYCTDLEQLTNIDSGTGNTEGSAKMAEYVKAKVEALGGTVEFRPNDKGTYVIGRVKGEGTLRVLLLAHTDTVFKQGEAAKRPFRIDKDAMKAYGPGVWDDKSNVASTIYLVKALKDLDYRKFGEIILYYSAEEETGSAFSDKIITELAQQSDVCFVMDGGAPGWGVTDQRKGVAKYKMTVEGRSYHAGIPTRGANAVMELNNQLTKLYRLVNQPLFDPDTMTPAALKAKGIVEHGQFIPPNTINVGIIGTTNTSPNTIPANAFAEFETRFYQIAEGKRLDREIKAQVAKTVVPGTKVTITGGITCGPMEKTPQVQKIIDMYKGIVKREYNADILERSSGGVTDGNIAAVYVPTIDSVSVEGLNAHLESECVDLKSFVPRIVVLIECIQELADKWPVK